MVEVKKITMKDILAVVTGISQVFYLTGNSKCFMIDVAVKGPKDEGLKKSTIVARLAGLHNSFKVSKRIIIHTIFRLNHQK